MTKQRPRAWDEFRSLRKKLEGGSRDLIIEYNQRGYVAPTMMLGGSFTEEELLQLHWAMKRLRMAKVNSQGEPREHIQ